MSATAVNGALDFMGPVAEGLVLACGWIIADAPTSVELAWRSGSKAKATPFQSQWTDRPDLADYLENGAPVAEKLGFIGVFPAPSGSAGLSVEVRAGEIAPIRIVLKPPAETFAGYFLDAPPSARFTIVELLGHTTARMSEAERLAYSAALQPWLESLPLCESSASVSGITIGLDTFLIGDDGQIFGEGWMKATGQSRTPSLRLALTNPGGFSCRTVDQSVLRPDIAPPGAGGLRRPGFFLVAQSHPAPEGDQTGAVLELQSGSSRHHLRLVPRPAKGDAWRSAFSNRVADDVRVSDDARRSLLDFFARPALPVSAPATGKPTAAIAAICVADVSKDDPCRGLIQASLARLPLRDLAIIVVADESTVRKAPDIGPAWPGRQRRMIFAETLAAGLRSAALEAHDPVLFLSSATLLKPELLASLDGALAAASTSHCVFAPEDMPAEHKTALERLLAASEAPTGEEARARRSVPYLDFFAPLVAPAGDMLRLADGWAPLLPGMLFREAVRRAAAAGAASLLPLSGIATYRQHANGAGGLAALYKEAM